VVGNDDCVYGIPNEATRIVKYNPANPDITSIVGDDAQRRRIMVYCGNGVLASGGYIYAVNNVGQVLQVDTTRNNYYTWIGDQIYSGSGRGRTWGDPIVGIDKCIYWPPLNANRVLKFDPETQQLPSLVGDDLGEEGYKWQGGALSTIKKIINYYTCTKLFTFRIKRLDVSWDGNTRENFEDDVWFQHESVCKCFRTF